MDIRSFYAEIGGDYDEISARLVSEKLILKYVKRFTEDTGFSELLTAFENDNVNDAFRAAHTLKGSCSTLGLGNIYKDAYELTELLRNKDFIDKNIAVPVLERLKINYNKTINCINALD